MDLDLSHIKGFEAYNLLTQTLVPRPVAWVLSDNGDGSLNLAPFSYFAALGSDPMLFTLSIGNKSGGQAKDTLRNLGEGRDFVVHIPHREQARQVTDSARPLDFGESEVEFLGLHLTPFEGYSLPRIADCRIAYGCSCHQVLEIGPGRQPLVVCQIHHVHIDDSLVIEEPGQPLRLDTARLNPLARLGGEEYVAIGEVIHVPSAPAGE